MCPFGRRFGWVRRARYIQRGNCVWIGNDPAICDRESYSAMKQTRPRLALTIGDPAGVGPELCLAALNAPGVQDAYDLLLVGTESLLNSAGAAMGSAVPRTVPILDVGEPEGPIPHGVVSREAGRLSAAYLDRAIALALSGEVDAIVTAPICKEAWHLAGVPYPGHTEFLAARAGSQEFGMMLVHGNWRVLHMSTHCSLRDAIGRVTRPRVFQMLKMFDAALRDLGIAAPRIGVAGLNPHAGEGGLFGDEEAREIAPGIEDARNDGIDAKGPVAPDTIFARARKGDFDGVLAMYHDQGHIAVKTVAFEPSSDGGWSSVHGVNVTIGLPIIRTSVDHGVAFDIAGKGVASPESMLEAIRLAGTMVSNRSRKADR